MTTWLEADHLFDWPEEHVQHPDHHPFDSLVDLLREYGWTEAIGVEMDNYYYSARSHEILETAFGRDAFADATGLVNWQRAVKSEQELQLMQAAGKLSAHMHGVLRAEFNEGIPKNALVARVQAAGIEGVPLRSAVRAPPRIAAATAASIRSAGPACPSEWRSIIAADRIAAHGFALPCPAMSGAEPWIGSYRPLASLLSEADGSIPIEPAHIDA